MVKEINESINIDINVKSFLTSKKGDFKLKYKRFYPVPAILMHYLKDSPEFTKDYLEYCKSKGLESGIEVKEDITHSNQKIIDTIKIMEYENKDVLSILNND